MLWQTKVLILCEADMAKTKTKIAIRYIDTTPEKNGRPWLDDEDELFVDIDYNSGGYPYAVTAMQAHDFKSTDDALRYIGHFKNMEVVELEMQFTVRKIDA
jgi:hypothetical protein